jgi:hypothetical protein
MKKLNRNIFQLINSFEIYFKAIKFNFYLLNQNFDFLLKT